MKKRLPKTQSPKPETDKTYSGRQKRYPKAAATSNTGENTPPIKRTPDRTKSKELSETGFRKNKRKRITSSSKSEGQEIKKKFSSDKGRPFVSKFKKAEKRDSEDNQSTSSKFSDRNKTDRPDSKKKDFKGKEFKGKEFKGKESKKPYRPSRSSTSGSFRRETKETPTYKFFSEKKKGPKSPEKKESNEIRLNRYIANAGICSRREADELIAQGLIKVNDKIITEMGYKVNPGDKVKYENKILKREKFVYVLLNKPKDFITTTDDPEERRTVMDLVKNACDERIYPVGRLDRNTTGLLLLTNDGELAETLSHPSNNVKKVYQVEIDKPITDEDFDKIKAGVELEDGKAYVDDLAIVTADAQVLGIEIHLGRNRIVRRIFEHLGYIVTRLDRVTYAGLSKKDLPRGHWRFLTEKEVIQLKHFS